ncbi:hypothetical protein QTP70_032340 [Hemibagrus guttatus]|uniref:ribonuclease H n=1 Tax=Hemibagrus guttatus TaxID=175788 RepID=A0AAE0UUC5_9TELE|nr:hypothetical protein QTP70_032340 [Hemibagrus guttatus]
MRLHSLTLGQRETSSPHHRHGEGLPDPRGDRETPSAGEVLKWGEHCFEGCFPERPGPKLSHIHEVQVHATSVERPLENRSIAIPACYSRFSDVFCPKKASKLPPHRPWDCAIDLIPSEPVPRGRIYSLSLPEEKAMEEYITEALAQGYIRPSMSPAASSFFFVAKKDGGLQPCIDYRALNKITVKFRYPLSLVPAALERLRSATVFTKLNLRSAYNLIWIREGDEWKTAFVTPTGHYEYLVMPYGLVNAPSVFQDFMHEAEKCLFHQPLVQFLGYVIDRSGVRMDEKKVAAVRDWPTPTSVKELQQFLGFANFYRWFIKDYSSITSPLTNLLRNKPKALTWTPATTQAFDTLKKSFTIAPLLVHPDPELPFVVEVNASTTGVGAVLSQQQGNPRKLHPCAFFSRKLNPAEVNYDIGNRELLTVKLALEEWRHWLEGAKHPFTVLTEHKNLEYLWAAKSLDPRQARRALFCTRFHFTISYGPGSKNVKADTMSCIHSLEPTNEDPEPILPEKLFASPISWSEKTLPEPNAPADARQGALRGCSLFRGHDAPPSFTPRTRLWALATLESMEPSRSLNNISGSPTWQRISEVPLPGQPTALDTAEHLFNHVFRYYGLPEDIVSDRGPLFTSRVWRAFFKRLGVTISLSLGYHPQTNGQTERKIQEVSRFLRTFCHSHQESWSQFLGWAEYAQNSLRQSTMGFTPFQCMLGYQPSLFPWDGEPSDVPAVDYWFRESERV